ncbi:MAG: ABC transporter substrate-binding protein [Acetobacter papayae]
MTEQNLLFSRRKLIALAGMGSVAVPLALSYAHAQEGHVVTDCRGRRVAVGPARRIVCIGGTITETLYDLGAQARIIAVDTTSTWPESALKDKKSIGYMRTVSAEGVLSLQPDLILAMNNAGPPAAMDQLVASGPPVVFVEATPSVEAIVARTAFLSGIVGADEAGRELVAKIEKGFDALAQWRATHTTKRRVLFVMRMTNGHPMVAGSGTAADAIIGLTGATNAGHAMQGYKVVEHEALITLQPDVILIMAQDSAALHKDILADAGFRMTPAVRHDAIIALEGEELLGFGPRTPEAALKLAGMIEAASPA